MCFLSSHGPNVADDPRPPPPSPRPHLAALPRKRLLGAEVGTVELRWIMLILLRVACVTPSLAVSTRATWFPGNQPSWKAPSSSRYLPRHHPLGSS